MPDTFGAAFGRLVKRKRAQAKLTQAQLACLLFPNLTVEEAEKRKSDVSNLERGRIGNPNAQTIQRYSMALGITEADISSINLRLNLPLSEQLSDVAALDRDQLELLASRFDISKPHSQSNSELRRLLTLKAQEYRRLRVEVNSIDTTLKRLSNLKGAAQDAIAQIDLDRVESILAQVQQVELEEAAKTAELRAQNALLRGKSKFARRLLSAAAQSFSAVDPVETVRRIVLDYFPMLREHGITFGDNALSEAESLLRSIRLVEAEASGKCLLLTARSGLAFLAVHRGLRSEGDAGLKMLRRGVKNYEDLLEEISPTKDKALWIDIMFNLAIALRNIGIREKGEVRRRNFDDCFAAYRSVLSQVKVDDNATRRAEIQNSLGNALAEQGIYENTPKCNRLLTEATQAYSEALKFRTKARLPVSWAKTQNNLAIVLKTQALRCSAKDGVKLLSDAIECYRGALTVLTSKEEPVLQAMARENLAVACFEMSKLSKACARDGWLEEALIEIDAAIAAFDPNDMSYRLSEAEKERKKILAEIQN